MQCKGEPRIIIFNTIASNNTSMNFDMYVQYNSYPSSIQEGIEPDLALEVQTAQGIDIDTTTDSSTVGYLIGPILSSILAYYFNYRFANYNFGQRNPHLKDLNKNCVIFDNNVNSSINKNI